MICAIDWNTEFGVIGTLNDNEKGCLYLCSITEKRANLVIHEIV